MTIAGTFTGTAGVIAFLLAVIFLVTAMISWCPIWYTLGIRTRKQD